MEIQASMGSAEPVGNEKAEQYWDIDQAAAFLGCSRAGLWILAELGLVPAHRLEHANRYCWKFKASELLSLEYDDVTEPGVAIQ